MRAAPLTVDPGAPAPSAPPCRRAPSAALKTTARPQHARPGPWLGRLARSGAAGGWMSRGRAITLSAAGTSAHSAAPSSVRSLVLSATLLAALTLSPHPAWAQGAAGGASPGAAPSAAALAGARMARGGLPPVEGEVIVRLRPGASALAAGAQAAAGTSTPAAAAASLQHRAALLGRRHGLALQAGGAIGERSQVLRVAGMDAEELARRLAADPEVEFADPNGRRRIAAMPPAFIGTPDDPLFLRGPVTDRSTQTGGPDSGQWYLRAPTAELRSAIDIGTAWARSTGRPEVVVAVLDTGVRFEHPDLRRAEQGGRLLPGYDFVSDSIVANDGSGRDADPSDPGDWITAEDQSNHPSRFRDCDVARSSWHGTATASLVAASANDGVGMAGAAPNVRVLPLRVLGKCYGTDGDIQAAMRWAVGLRVAGVPDNPHPARVLNLSLGSTGACSASYQAVVDEVLATGAVIVAAAGNSAGGPVGTPGSCRGVIAVAGLRHAGSKVGFSDLGREIALAAPGGNCVDIRPGDPCRYPILAASDSGRFGAQAPIWTDAFRITVGTSFSSPLVAATAALMFSARPELTPADVRGILRASARPFPTDGADNGDDPQPVTECRAPSSNVEQLQCYCNTRFCGAGMLDAGRAVTAVDGPLARMQVLPANPQANSPVQLSAGGSVAPTGRQIVAWRWAISEGGGIVNGFTSADNAATATLRPTGAGRFAVRLSVTDDQGQTGSVDVAVAVAADPGAPPLPPLPAPPATGGGSSSGGGAMSPGWLLALLASAALLRRRGRDDGG
jgi:serine protease